MSAGTQAVLEVMLIIAAGTGLLFLVVGLLVALAWLMGRAVGDMPTNGTGEIPQTKWETTTINAPKGMNADDIARIVKEMNP